MVESTDPELDQLLGALLKIMAGHQGVRLPVEGVEDIWAGIHTAINITAEELESALIAREREAQERRGLALELLRAHDAWRRRVARDLHDESGQLLTSVTLGLRALEDRQTDRALTQELYRLRTLTDETMQSLRRISHGLHNLLLDDLGLVAAIERTAEDLFAARTVQFRLQTRGFEDAPPLAPELELTVFRVVQEALTNAAKHAGADNVSVVLDRNAERVRVIIEDDGCGASLDLETGRPCGGGMGVLGMLERAKLQGGTLDFEAGGEDGGTTVYLEVPIP